MFSRKLNDMTGKYPDAVEAVCKAFKGPLGQLFIIDAEIVAVEVTGSNCKTGGERILPFQSLSSRKRADVTAANAATTVSVKVRDP